MVSRLTTPPPPSNIKTPPTPRHGYEDSWEPYSPRKSARVSSRRLLREARTPPPQSSSHNLRGSNSSPPSTIKVASTGSAELPSSPPATISKKRASKSAFVGDSRRVSGALNEDTTASAAEALGLSPTRDSKMASHQTTINLRNSSMLPTPAKTPKKRPSEASPGITTIARNLFPVHHENVEDVMPPKKNTRKRYTGFTLGSFRAEDVETTPIQIYTDSHERIPEVDLSSDNPFNAPASTALPDPTKRSSKRRKIMIPGEGEQTLEEAEKREDGLIYVFRGKKIFRKFTELEQDVDPADEASNAELDAELDATVPARLRGPLTRSSLKPRLLFQTPEQIAVREKKPEVTDDEEAVTDIEEPSATEFSTPAGQVDDLVTTPKAPKFVVSPPTTIRATRSAKKTENASSADTSTLSMPGGMDGAHDSDHGVKLRGGKVSPFDGWRRTKYGTPSHGKKREGDAITRSGGEVSKRQRGGRAQAT